MASGRITPINFDPHAAPDAPQGDENEPSKPYSGSREAWDSIEGWITGEDEGHGGPEESAEG